jgi:hypothetical protein
MVAKPHLLPSHICANYLLPQKADPICIRFAVGGDCIHYKGAVSTPTGDLTTFKIIINSTISTDDTRFMCMDIKAFYLKTPMNRFEYMRIPVKDIPLVIMELHDLAPLVDN